MPLCRGRRAAAVVAVLAGCLTLAACGGDDDPEPAGPAPATETTSAAPTPAPTPATPAEPETFDLNPLDWRSREGRGQPYELHRYRGGYLGLETQGVSRLTAGGKIVWHWAPKRKDDLGTFLAGDVPVVEPSLKPRGDHEVIALDPRTGKELWRAPSNGYAATDDERVFATTCTGGPDDDPDGDCTMTAYDARSGAVLWVDAFGTYTENTFLVGERTQRLLVQSFPDGRHSSQFLLDPTTGAVVDSDIDEAERDYAIYPPLSDAERLTVLTPDRDPSDGCRTTIAAFDLDGNRLWSRTLPGTTAKRPPKVCDDPFSYDARDTEVVHGFDSPTVALDSATGAVLWRSNRPLEVEQIADGAVLVSDSASDTTEALDLRTGQVRWRAPVYVGGWDVEGRYIAGNTLTCGQNCSVVVDARTGRTLLHVRGIAESYVPSRRPGGPPSLLTRIDDPQRYRASYGFVTLPRLDSGR